VVGDGREAHLHAAAGAVHGVRSGERLKRPGASAVLDKSWNKDEGTCPTRHPIGASPLWRSAALGRLAPLRCHPSGGPRRPPEPPGGALFHDYFNRALAGPAKRLRTRMDRTEGMGPRDRFAVDPVHPVHPCSATFFSGARRYSRSLIARPATTFG
jgi:hypothetical protein